MFEIMIRCCCCRCPRCICCCQNLLCSPNSISQLCDGLCEDSSCWIRHACKECRTLSIVRKFLKLRSNLRRIKTIDCLNVYISFEIYKLHNICELTWVGIVHIFCNCFGSSHDIISMSAHRPDDTPQTISDTQTHVFKYGLVVDAHCSKCCL